MMHGKRLLAVAIIGFAAIFAACEVGAQTPSTKAAPIATDPVHSRIDVTFSAWDTDKSGSLSLQEFRNGWIGLRRAGEMQRRLRAQFEVVDIDKSGAIDAGEYARLQLIKRLGKPAPPLSNYDANKNKRLEFPEYLNLVRQMTVPRRGSPAPTSKSP